MAAFNNALTLNKLKAALKLTAGATLFFGAVCISRGEEKFYEDVVMPTVRFLPAEVSHKLAVFACKYKLLPISEAADPSNLTTHFFGKELTNPIGIAAGFDKNGEAVEGLLDLGFGFVEIGSVTPRAQPGNPAPRVFRLANDEAIINRYGFNNEGHEKVFQRVSQLREDQNFHGIVGVNLGKNKNTKKARLDYVQGVQTFGPVSDYLVINVSSPNTPGLRKLQNKDHLERLLKSVVDTRDNLPVNNTVPIFLKLSPDLEPQDLNDIAEVVMKKGSRVDGLIVSNTTVSRENLIENTSLANQEGGLSGPPLRSKSTQLVADLYYLTDGKIPIIGVGGISTGQDAFEKITAGATYVQFYTALVYQGPMVVNRIKEELSEILNERGFQNVAQAVGTNNAEFKSKEVTKKKFIGLFNLK